MAFGAFSKKEKLGLFIALGIVGLALFDRLIINPINTSYRQLDREVKVAQSQLYQDIANINQKDQIESQYQKYKQYVKNEGSDEEIVGKMLAEIEEISRQSGVDIIDIKPQSSRQEDIFKNYEVEVEAEGTIQGLTEFLYRLSNSKQLFRTGKLHISLKDKTSSLLRISVLVTKIVIP